MAWPMRWLAPLLFVAAASPAAAEWYVAGQGGVTFADRISNVRGTGSLSSLSAVQDFDLKNSVMYGAKIGYFPGHGAIGVEAEAFNTTPHIKTVSTAPGIHLRVTTLAVNLVARYPGVSVQPYVGIGLGIFFSHLGSSPTTQSDSDVRTGLNAMAGVRFFVTPYVSVFTEYKINATNMQFNNAFGSVGGFTGDYLVQFGVAGIAYHF